MKHITMLLVPLSLTLCASAFADDLTVTITGFESTAGKVRCGLYRSEKGFPGGNPNVGVRSKVKSDKTSVCVFKDVKPGTYAVAVAHDKNSNGKLDKTFIGFPTEGWGVSNNAPMGSFGPPSFDDAKIKVGAKGATVAIQLNQP